MYNRYEGPTVLNIPVRWERVLCYAFGWLSGLVMFIIERENHNVRRHAAQSMIVFGGLSILLWIANTLGGLLGGIWVIGFLFSGAFWLVAAAIILVGIVLYVALMLMALLGNDFFLPLGRTYERLLG